MENLNEIFINHATLSQEWMWGIFGVSIMALLFFDLFIFNRKNEVPNIAHTIVLCALYILAGCLFGVFVIYEKGLDQGMLFFTGFLVEKSLSLDNIFVISMIFAALSIPRQYQHRVLFWGILGAIIMRALLIALGDALISSFHWVLYIFSAFLIYTGIKMLSHVNAKEEDNSFEKSKIYLFISKFFHVSKEIEGDHFIIKKDGKRFITPLFFALILVEAMDVVFALDSIPAIFLITQDVFIVYTSNIFAILGLRALYFLLEAAVHKFSYLKHALSLILIFIGLKIFAPYIGWDVQEWQSLSVTFLLIFGGIGMSIYKPTK